MRIVRSLLLAVVTAAGLILVVDPDTVAADDAKTKLQQKKQKKEQRLKMKAEAAKKATVEAAKKQADVAHAEPSKPAVLKPVAHTAAEVAKLIDDQIDRKLAEAKTAAAPLCSDAEFLRRVYLDLTGVIPTADKARAFLDDPSPDKRTKLVDDLLASQNYGRHQADLWTPKLFPRDSMNRFVSKDPLNKWIEEQFNKNTPWDQFVTQLVTATGSVEEHPEVTYFLANRSVDKLTDTVSQHFLGIQLQCAQCHNHPFTNWKQTEYWGMAAFFSKVQPQNPKNANKGGDNTKLTVTEGNGKTRLKDFFPESTKTVPAKFLGGPEPKLGAGEPYRPALAKWLTSAENPFFARAAVNRTWALLFGRGIVDPVDDMHDGNEPSHPGLLAALASELVGSGFDLKHLVRGICASKAYQRGSKLVPGAEHDPKLFATMAVKVMTPEQLYDSLTQVVGQAASAQGRPRPMGMKGGPAGPRDQFVNFFLAGADQPTATEYEAGIPQALRLMNSNRMAGNAGKAFAKPGAKPAAVFEEIYLGALARRPTSEEVARLTAYMAKAGPAADGYGDVLWAVLNSSEFTMVR